MALTYGLVTAVRDEEKYIGNLLQSVVDQTLLPSIHVVVNDGSQDRTGEILAEYANHHHFIKVITRPRSTQRTFNSKVAALTAGFDVLLQESLNYVGCLDADMTFNKDYYRSVLVRMEDNPRIGMASGILHDWTPAGFKALPVNINHVPGNVQLFRRKCYEDVGGYKPVSVAGEDSIAEIRAKMKGWIVRSFPDLVAYHHKPMGSAMANPLKGNFRDGLTDYHLGKHPLFMILKAARRLPARPVLLGSIARLVGFFWLFFRRAPRDVTPEMVRFVQLEEWGWIKALLLKGERQF